MSSPAPTPSKYDAPIARAIGALPLVLLMGKLVFDLGLLRGLLVTWGFLAAFGGASLVADAVLLFVRAWTPTTGMPYLVPRLLGTAGFHVLAISQGNAVLSLRISLYSIGIAIVLCSAIGLRAWLATRRRREPPN